MYRCSGFFSKWTRCIYSTTKPQRVKGKWKIPAETNNDHLLKWFKSQKVEKPERVFPSKSPFGPSNSQGANSSQSSNIEDISSLRVVIAGILDESVVEQFKEAGGQVDTEIKAETNCLVVSGPLNHATRRIKDAREMKIPIVREDYLANCTKRQKRLPFNLYEINIAEWQISVHEASGLQDSGHILEDGSSIYNTTLSKSDLSTGINSYYILQIIQDHKTSDCYVFRKWGRVGSVKNGGKKTDKMSKSDAILEFKRLFKKMTRNSWEAWENNTFQQKAGGFYKLDIDYGYEDFLRKKKPINFTNTKLAPQLVELLRMLFDLETYRAAMKAYQIDLSVMPLGRLRPNNIKEGFKALTKIQNLLNTTAYTPEVRESLIFNASNEFFTIIPSNVPHTIKDEDDFKLKVKMLEALQEIKIASDLLGFEDNNCYTVDEKYEMLRCHMYPLSHDSEDFKLIENYLKITHAPTHTKWTLELEEVFSLEREGEKAKYTQHYTKLKNKMLLWHGSSFTNFVGILSGGLKIAPPEVPKTGYMFGKGIYFADLASKSAQYCNTNPDNPIGLLLLSEVALGESYELKEQEYMDKPPNGKHSTKGLGKIVTRESEHVKWRDDVVVPRGKLVASKVTGSKLDYNEYIVYDTSQVKLQFLVKVRFHFKSTKQTHLLSLEAN